jgi:hypothetical protein
MLCRTNAPPEGESSCRDSPEESGLQAEQESVRARRKSSRPNGHLSRSRSRHRTIARLMLAPCSTSSMLSASLRPGQRPGLRALTTPPRGTFSATTRWSATCRSLEDHSKRVDAGIAQAYVDIITSVPHGTPSVRRHGLRSAHPASAHRARYRAHPKHRRLMHDDREWFVGASIELRTSVPLAAHHPQDHALRRGRVHQRRCICPGLTERSRRSNHSRSSPLGA